MSESPSILDTPCDDLDAVFGKIRALMHNLSGVHLSDSKKELVRARIGKRLRALGCRGFRQYLEFVVGPQGGEELAHMVDLLTTNQTSFFREPAHFHFLKNEVLPRLRSSPRVFRMWSAGCASGEEPYSLAILLLEEIPGVLRKDVKILATDLSRRALAQARAGVYEESQLRQVPPSLRSRYFTPLSSGPEGKRRYRVNAEVRAMVRIAWMNLMDPWPMRGPFDVIFCRNVMIYFDRITRERLVQRFSNHLRPGGYLMVGHSESLSGLRHDLHYVQAAVYRK